MLRLANGSRILSLPGTARSVRGWTRGCSSSTRPRTSTPRRSSPPGRSSRPVAGSSCSRRPRTSQATSTQSSPATTRAGPGSRCRATRCRPSRQSSSSPSGGRSVPTPTPASTSASSARPARRCSRSTGSPLILPEAAMRHIGIVIADRGSAIVTVERDDGRRAARHRHRARCRSTSRPSPTGAALDRARCPLRHRRRGPRQRAVGRPGPRRGPELDALHRPRHASARRSSTSCSWPSRRTGSTSRPGWPSRRP